MAFSIIKQGDLNVFVQNDGKYKIYATKTKEIKHENQIPSNFFKDFEAYIPEILNYHDEHKIVFVDTGFGYVWYNRLVGEEQITFKLQKSDYLKLKEILNKI